MRVVIVYESMYGNTRVVVLSFAGDEQRDESAKLVRQAFRSAIGSIPRDVALTIEIPEGDPGPVLTNIAIADGDLLVVGTEQRKSVKRLVHGSVSSYCSRHAHCPVAVVTAPRRDQAASL